MGDGKMKVCRVVLCLLQGFVGAHEDLGAFFTGQIVAQTDDQGALRWVDMMCLL